MFGVGVGVIFKLYKWKASNLKTEKRSFAILIKLINESKVNSNKTLLFKL
jgi:hypothetical protein